jgi:hypothetical protein
MINERLVTVLLISLGWLLGLLSPAVTKRINRAYDKKEFLKVLDTELNELRYRLAATVYLIESHYGQVDRALLQWLYPIVKRYKGPNPSKNILGNIEAKLNLDDEQIKAFSEQIQAVETGLMLKKHALPILDSYLTLLPALDKVLQNRLVDIKTNLNLLNEEVDEARFYFRLTFNGKLSEENYARVLLNFKDHVQNFSSRAKNVADKISGILSKEE